MGIVSLILGESLHLLRGGGESDEIKVNSAQPCSAFRFGRGMQRFLFQSVEDETIDVISRPCQTLGGRRLPLRKRLKTPVIPGPRSRGVGDEEAS